MSLRTQLRRSADDRGAFAILYAAAIVLFISFAAIVVDLGSARFDRRINRSAADSAALGAVTLLQSDSRDAPKACKKAWKYLRSSIHSPDLTTMTDAEIDTACTPFAGFTGICPAATIAYPYVVRGDYAITMTWPVMDDSVLMTKPDVRPGEISDQAYDPAFDGDTANPERHCDRFGVSVQHIREFRFASAVGGPSGTSTLVSSVARSAAKGTSGDAVVALLVLERTGCKAIFVQGSSGASVVVRGRNTRPGIIHADSDASAGSCSTSSTVLNGQFGPPPRIKAEQAPIGTPAAPGLIGIVALGGPNAAFAHDPAPATVEAQGSPGGKPVARPLLGRSRVDARYRLPVIDTVADGRSLWSLTAAQAAAPPYSFTVLDCTHPGAGSETATRVFVDCPNGVNYTSTFTFINADTVVYNGPVQVSGGASTILSYPKASEIYIKGSTVVIPAVTTTLALDAPIGSTTIQVADVMGLPTTYPYNVVVGTGSGKETVTITSASGNVLTLSSPTTKYHVVGDVVSFGGVNASGLSVGGRFKVNDNGEATCTDRFVSDRSARAKLVIGNGSMRSSGAAPELRLCGTGVVMADDYGGTCPIPSVDGVPPYSNACRGEVDLAGNTLIDWLAPNAVGPDPGASDFAELEDLALWTEASARSSIAGNGGLTMAGVFFLPNADPFRIGGNGFQDVENAQFIARRLELGGNGTLTMRPDPDDVVLFPYIGGITLIR